MHKSILLLLIVAVLLVGCSIQVLETQEDSTIVLGFSQLGSESGWRLGNTASIKEAAANAGIDLMYENAEQKQENQIKAIRSFIAYQVDVISFAPIVMDGWDNVLMEARNAGIPVLITDRRINTSDPTLYAGFIGSDFHQEGISAGEFLLKRTKNYDHVNIVEITGTIDSSPALQRSEGFYQVIAGNEKYSIIENISGDFMRTKGYECMEGVLKNHKDIDVVYSHNDAMTYGAIAAIEKNGLVPGKDIIIITVDGEQEAIDLLKIGKVNCVVECTPMIGDTVMKLAKLLASGKKIEQTTLSVETVFTEYDDLTKLPERGY